MKKFNNSSSSFRSIKVLILGDGLSCSVDMGKNPMYYALGTHPNVTIRFYNNLNLLKPWTFNGRMHDKYIIIDDQILLLGGRNTSGYFLGNSDGKHLSYDRDILVYNCVGFVIKVILLVGKVIDI